MLQEEQIQKIRLVLSSSGWNDVVKPSLLYRGKEAVRALCLAPSEREGQFKDLSDESLRAIIREVEWLATCWDNEILVFEHNRRLEELERAKNGSTAANP